MENIDTRELLTLDRFKREIKSFDRLRKLNLIGSPNGLATLGTDGKLSADQIPSTSFVYQGAWDASLGTYPDISQYKNPVAGYFWVVSNEGTIENEKYRVNDWIVINADNSFSKRDNTDDVLSVNGYVGTITLDSSDIKYKTNLESTITDCIDETRERLDTIETITKTGTDNQYLSINGTTHLWKNPINVLVNHTLPDSNRLITSNALTQWNGSSIEIKTFFNKKCIEYNAEQIINSLFETDYIISNESNNSFFNVKNDYVLYVTYDDGQIIKANIIEKQDDNIILHNYSKLDNVSLNWTLINDSFVTITGNIIDFSDEQEHIVSEIAIKQIIENNNLSHVSTIVSGEWNAGNVTTPLLSASLVETGNISSENGTINNLNSNSIFSKSINVDSINTDTIIDIDDSIGISKQYITNENGKIKWESRALLNKGSIKESDKENDNLIGANTLAKWNGSNNDNNEYIYWNEDSESSVEDFFNSIINNEDIFISSDENTKTLTDIATIKLYVDGEFYNYLSSISRIDDVFNLSINDSTFILSDNDLTLDDEVNHLNLIEVELNKNNRKSSITTLSTITVGEWNAGNVTTPIITANSGEITEFTSNITTDHENRISVAEEKIDILNGDEKVTGSVRKQVSDAIAAVINEAPESLDTLKEISDWLSNHATEAGEMNTAISQNEKDIREIEKDVIAKYKEFTTYSNKTNKTIQNHYDEFIDYSINTDKRLEIIDDSIVSINGTLKNHEDRLENLESQDIITFGGVTNVVFNGVLQPKNEETGVVDIKASFYTKDEVVRIFDKTLDEADARFLINTLASDSYYTYNADFSAFPSIDESLIVIIDGIHYQRYISPIVTSENYDTKVESDYENIKVINGYKVFIDGYYQKLDKTYAQSLEEGKSIESCYSGVTLRDIINRITGDHYNNQSIDEKIENAINNFTTTLTNNNKIDTFVEIVDYIAEHSGEFGELVSTVNKKLDADVIDNYYTKQEIENKDYVNSENLNNSISDIQKEFSEKIINFIDEDVIDNKIETATDGLILETTVNDKLAEYAKDQDVVKTISVNSVDIPKDASGNIDLKVNTEIWTNVKNLFTLIDAQGSHIEIKYKENSDDEDNFCGFLHIYGVFYHRVHSNEAVVMYSDEFQVVTMKTVYPVSGTRTYNNYISVTPKTKDGAGLQLVFDGLRSETISLNIYVPCVKSTAAGDFSNDPENPELEHIDSEITDNTQPDKSPEDESEKEEIDAVVTPDESDMSEDESEDEKEEIDATVTPDESDMSEDESEDEKEEIDAIVTSDESDTSEDEKLN